MTIPLGAELRHLLNPVGIDEFLAEYAGRRALLIKGSTDKFTGLEFDREAFFAACERFDINANRLKAAVPSEDEGENYVPVMPFQARGLFAAGLTICATAISDEHPRLAAFAEGIRHGLSIPDLRFNSYLSPDDSGFNLHYDVQPIFLVQLEGRKRWWYGAQAIEPMPRVYSSRYPRKPDLDTLEHTVLEPGDVLYLPAFTWHRARAAGYSLGITLGAKGHHNKVMRRALDQSPFFGEWPVQALEPPLDPVAAGSGGVPENARQYLEAQLEVLRGHVAELSVEDLWQFWVDEVQESKGPRPSRREGEVFSTLVIRRSDSFPVHIDQVAQNGGDKLRLRHIGHTVLMETRFEGYLRELLARDGEFTVADATTLGGEHGLTRSECKRVIRELIAVGALDPVRAQ